MQGFTSSQCLIPDIFRDLQVQGKAQNAEALGKALALTSVLPWTLCNLEH